MGKIYDTQTDLTLLFETEKDLTGIAVNSILLKGINPLGAAFSYPVTIEDEKLGIVKFTVNNQQKLNIVGYWIFWIQINNNSLVSIGESSKKYVNKEGE